MAKKQGDVVVTSADKRVFGEGVIRVEVVRPVIKDAASLRDVAELWFGRVIGRLGERVDELRRTLGLKKPFGKAVEGLPPSYPPSPEVPDVAPPSRATAPGAPQRNQYGLPVSDNTPD